MSDTEELLRHINELTEKLNRAHRQLAGLRAKGKYLGMQYDDAREREKNSTDLVMGLLERQRELNVMLNRANIMLNRTQETMALTSMEFNEMAKALPEPKKAEWADRVARINELFKKSGVQDAELVALQSANPPDSLETDELQRQSQEAFHQNEAIWARTETREPPMVEAVPVEDSPDSAEPAQQAEPEVMMVSHEPEGSGGKVDEESLIFPPRRKSWWRRAAG